jgi:hypothetical protein
MSLMSLVFLAVKVSSSFTLFTTGVICARTLFFVAHPTLASRPAAAIMVIAIFFMEVAPLKLVFTSGFAFGSGGFQPHGTSVLRLRQVQLPCQ